MWAPKKPALHLAACSRRLAPQVLLQIGMDTGNVAETVLGRKLLPRWKLFGDTVNTASRWACRCAAACCSHSCRLLSSPLPSMKSSGAPDVIQMSDRCVSAMYRDKNPPGATDNQFLDELGLILTREVPKVVKGKGVMQTYYARLATGAARRSRTSATSSLGAAAAAAAAAYAAIEAGELLNSLADQAAKPSSESECSVPRAPRRSGASAKGVSASPIPAEGGEAAAAAAADVSTLVVPFGVGDSKHEIPAVDASAGVAVAPAHAVAMPRLEISVPDAVRRLSYNVRAKRNIKRLQRVSQLAIVVGRFRTTGDQIATIVRSQSYKELMMAAEADGGESVCVCVCVGGLCVCVCLCMRECLRCVVASDPAPTDYSLEEGVTAPAKRSADDVRWRRRQRPRGSYERAQVISDLLAAVAADKFQEDGIADVSEIVEVAPAVVGSPPPSMSLRALPFGPASKVRQTPVEDASWRSPAVELGPMTLVFMAAADEELCVLALGRCSAATAAAAVGRVCL